VYLADNNSEDRTREIAREMGANVVIEPVRGIGPARQNGLDALKKISGVSHTNIILIQTDTDSALLHRNYIQKVCESYENQPELAATVGATHFPVNTRRKSPTMIRGGKQFKDTFNTLSFSELFSECGRDIHHYLLDPPFRMLIGANATYRLSELEALDIEYPKDTRWESVVVSVLLQMKMSSKRIGFIPEQEIVTSPRAYSNNRGIATKKKLEEIQSKRYIAPFKSENSVSPLETLRDLIEQIDRKTYGLSEHERVISYVSEYPDFILPNQRIECAYHAGTGLAIQGKYVLIEKEFAIYQQEAIEHAQRDLRIIQKIQDSLMKI
jgi:glycosyltransferase involved in cell wall biosynthesis